MKFIVAFFSTEIRAWNGEEPLRDVFWVHGVIKSCVIAVFCAAAIYNDQVVLEQILLLGFAVYTIWILVSVWRCAYNVQEKFWSLLARLLTVAWAANSIMVLVFLQLDLMMNYFGR